MNFEVVKSIITKVLKLVSKIAGLGGTALIVVIVLVINPWNTLAIFKRNYPDWFAAHPYISRFIKIN